MSVVRELAIVWLVIWGAAFIALAAVGLLRMPDLYSRLHAASKASALGIACLAIALVIQFEDPELGVRAVAFGLFLFITAPISAHLIARAAFVTGTPIADAYVVDETRADSSADPE